MIPGDALRFGFGRRLPVILQAEAAECGLACLAMVLSHHGHEVDLASLRRRHAVSLKGVTMRSLVQMAGSMQLATRAVRLEVADLARLRRPAILHWGMNHFVVLANVRGGKITIHDPARGRRTLPLAEVSREFTGVALETTPAQGFQHCDERRTLRLRDLFRQVGSWRPALLRILTLSLVLEAVALITPLAAQVVIDEVIVSADHDLLLTVAAGLGLLLLVQLVVGSVRSWAVMLASTDIAYHWNTGLFDHLTRLPLDFFERRHVGDVISRFGTLGTIQKALTTDLMQAVLDGVLAVGMLAMLFFYGGWLGAVACVATTVNLAIRIVAFNGYRQSTAEAIVYEAKQQTHFIETVRGMASVKLLGLRERRRAAWLNHLVDAVNARLRLQRLDIVFGRASDLIFGVDGLVMLALGAEAVMAGRLTVGMLVAFLGYKDQFTTRISSLVSAWFQLRMLDVQSQRLADISEAEPETDSTWAAVRVPTGTALAASSLRCEGVSFRYGGQEPWVLRNVSISVPAGRCLALVGPSGCGKTSLLKVMMGLLDPNEGCVMLDGYEIGGLGREAYRSRVAGVLQDDRLFAGTIAENITGFDEHPDLGWMEECAARSAILDDITRMPMRFESLVGDMGSALSGGQKQRVVLARALYRRPAILFLDEATSHLDEPTEALVAAALRELSMTRVIVAHRMETIQHADEVVTLAPARTIPASVIAV